MAIVLDNITKVFGSTLVVHSVSLEIKDGELFVLLGKSGSGKSTILRMIAGLIIPEEGRIELHGKDVTRLPPQKRDTGFVFQNYAIFRHLSVAGNVEFGLKIRSVDMKERQRRRNELLELVGLTGFADRFPHQLSGGQRQRVALARALAYNPSVLLLDEPFGALDVKIRSQLRRTLRDIQRELGVTTILVTHDQEEAFELAHRIGVLERGRLIEIGTPESLYYRPKTEFVATFVGSGNVIIGRSEDDKIKLGTALLPFPAGSPDHESGAPVRILFRPEAVRFQEQPFAEDKKVLPLGQGTLVERRFSGSFERLRFDVEHLRGSRQLAPALHYGQRMVSIEALRPLTGVEEQAVEQGSSYWVGLNHFHVLQPTGLKLLTCIGTSSSHTGAVSMTKHLIDTSHGLATFLHVGNPQDTSDNAKEALEAFRKAEFESESVHYDFRWKQGKDAREIPLEVQEGRYDLALLGRSAAETLHKSRLGLLTRLILFQAGVPVMIVPAEVTALRNILICTGAGEPGKSDVYFGGRLARHTGAHITVFHVAPQHRTLQEEARVRRHLELACASLDAYNIPSEIKIVQGSLVENIVREAHEGEYDLLILGALRSAGGEEGGMAAAMADIVRRVEKAVAIVPFVD